MSLSEGYRALREGAAILDLSGRGKIVATGEDRVRLLHAMVTNHVEELQPGQSCYTFFLNAQGRILADAHLFCRESDVLIDTEAETREKVFEHLDRYIIADDVELEDATGELATLGLEGPKAPEVLEAAGVDAPLTVPVDSTGAGGFSLIVPAANKDAVVRQLERAGGVPATDEDAEVVRIENGRPRHGRELTEDYIPHETQLLEAVHFNKGCYLGQEIVERVRSRGNVNKLLVQFRIDGDDPPPPGTRLTKDDKDAGVITSAVYSPALGKVAAMGYVKAIFASDGAEFQAGGQTAVLSSLRPS